MSSVVDTVSRWMSGSERWLCVHGRTVEMDQMMDGVMDAVCPPCHPSDPLGDSQCWGGPECWGVCVLLCVWVSMIQRWLHFWVQCKCSMTSLRHTQRLSWLSCWIIPMLIVMVASCQSESGTRTARRPTSARLTVIISISWYLQASTISCSIILSADMSVYSVWCLRQVVRLFVRSFVLSGVAVGCWQSFDVPSATASAEA